MLKWLKKLLSRNKGPMRNVVQVLRNEKWQTISGLHEVKKDETFRMLDPYDKTPIILEGSSSWKALSDGYLSKEGIGEIRSETIDE